MLNAIHSKRMGKSARGRDLGAACVLWILTCMAVLAFTAQSNADVIRFDNPAGAGHFDWRALNTGDQTYLNVLVDASRQTPDSGGSGAFIHRCRDVFGTDVVRAGLSGEGPQFVTTPSGLSYRVLPLNAGEEIPSVGADGFRAGAYVYHTQLPDPADPTTLFVAGEEAYFGVRFFDPAGSGLYNYGWIGVVPEWNKVPIGGVPTDVLVLDAFAWAYEIVPGVPIVAGIPEPGTLAALALVAMAALGRRRCGRSQID